MKKKNKRLLILYTNYGTGHYKAALSLQKYLESHYSDIAVQLMDPLSLGRPLINKVFASVGKIMATKFRRLRGCIYQRKMYRNYFKKSWFYDFCIKLFFTNRVKRAILEYNPDIIISTQVGPTGIIAKNKKIFKAKLISVLTDYGIHRMFTVAHEFVDQFWIPTEDLKREMIKLGIDKRKIMVTGIPVEDKFLVPKEISHKDYLKKLELPEDKPVFLFVCGGGNGYANALEYFDMLLNMSYDFSYIFVAGKNKRLYKKAQRLGDISGKFGVTLGYFENMDMLLRICTLVLGKPGGLITSEALSMGKPFIALNPIPGQEILNGKFIADNDFGYLINNKDDFKKFIAEIEKNDTILLKKQENIRKKFKIFTFPDMEDI
ncbi:MAG: UDP-N-acetylglucosamine 2-epimerase [Bacilli bacterium]|nr:UDP-N-acetylglucosamine 2-epimerase [Bacilli bacterium]